MVGELIPQWTDNGAGVELAMRSHHSSLYVHVEGAVHSVFRCTWPNHFLLGNLQVILLYSICNWFLFAVTTFHIAHNHLEGSR